jgi:hypothetical protein
MHEEHIIAMKISQVQMYLQVALRTADSHPSWQLFLRMWPFVCSLCRILDTYSTSRWRKDDIVPKRHDMVACVEYESKVLRFRGSTRWKWIMSAPEASLPLRKESPNPLVRILCGLQSWPRRRYSEKFLRWDLSRNVNWNWRRRVSILLQAI